MKEILRNILYRNQLTKKICKVRIRIHEWFLFVWPIYLKKLRNPKALFLVLTPTHGNIGDHAIALAEQKLLNDLNISYIEITDIELRNLQENNFLSCMNRKPILINGGGNLGTLWFSVEQLMRDIIVSNPKSSIVILPNTIYYENNDFGNEKLEESIEIYNDHPDLKIFARELTSYEFMKDIYENVELVPDIVLSLDSMDYKLDRQGCLLCLRKDREKTLCDDSYKNILNIVHKKFNDKVFMTDMCVNYSISSENRENEVKKKMNEFSKAQLVITDRLHCMIFCALTNTRCIVVNSKSPKIKGCYYWIKSLNFIKMVDSPLDIESMIDKLMSVKINNFNIEMNYNSLIKVLENLKKNER